jgi:hypothetical protein
VKLHVKVAAAPLASLALGLSQVTDKLEEEAEVDMLIVPANPSRLVRVIVEDCEEPTGISKAEGLAAILKSPLTVIPRVIE